MGGGGGDAQKGQCAMTRMRRMVNYGRVLRAGGPRARARALWMDGGMSVLAQAYARATPPPVRALRPSVHVEQLLQQQLLPNQARTARARAQRARGEWWRPRAPQIASRLAAATRAAHLRLRAGRPSARRLGARSPCCARRGAARRRRGGERICTYVRTYVRRGAGPRGSRRNPGAQPTRPDRAQRRQARTPVVCGLAGKGWVPASAPGIAGGIRVSRAPGWGNACPFAKGRVRTRGECPARPAALLRASRLGGDVGRGNGLEGGSGSLHIHPRPANPAPMPRRARAPRRARVARASRARGRSASDRHHPLARALQRIRMRRY